VETRRWVYYQWMREPAREVLKVAAQGVPAWQRALAPLMFPAMRAYLNRHLAITQEKVAQGMGVIRRSFDDVAAMLAHGRRYLCGERFTAADLAFASMAAPILLPPEYGIRLPSPELAPAAARADVEQFRAHPAGVFALRLFQENRKLDLRTNE
jgi:glutathione S-transferase